MRGFGQKACRHGRLQPRDPRGAEPRRVADVVSLATFFVRAADDHPLGDEIVQQAHYLEARFRMMDVVHRIDEDEPSVRAAVVRELGAPESRQIGPDAVPMLISQPSLEISQNRERELGHRLVHGRQVVTARLAFDLHDQQRHR